MMLAACTGGAPAGTATPTTPTTPATTPGASVVATNADILSPTQPVAEGEMFPTDPNAVPTAVLANLTAKKPMLVFYYDPTTKVAADTRKQIDAALKKHVGAIELVAIDYTAGLGSGTATATSSPEVDKAELMAGVLKVKTTPYLIFVDAEGRITYRFAGYVDRMLIEREVQRATE